MPIPLLDGVEHAFARLGAGAGLARCYERTVESARAWLAVTFLAYLLTRLGTEPP